MEFGYPKSGWRQREADAPYLHRLADACRNPAHGRLGCADDEASTRCWPQHEREGIGRGRDPQHGKEFRQPAMARRLQPHPQTERIDHGNGRTAPLQDVDFGANRVYPGEVLHELRKIDVFRVEPEDAGRLVDPGRQQGIGSAQD